MTYITKQLPVEMTADQLVIKGRQLADLNAQVRDIRLEKQAKTAEYNGLLKALEQEIQTATTVIRKGTVDKDVKCEERVDPDRGVVELIRLDTGEVVEMREATHADLQRELFRLEGDGRD